MDDKTAFRIKDNLLPDICVFKEGDLLSFIVVIKDRPQDEVTKFATNLEQHSRRERATTVTSTPGPRVSLPHIRWAMADLIPPPYNIQWRYTIPVLPTAGSLLAAISRSYEAVRALVQTDMTL